MKSNKIGVVIIALIFSLSSFAYLFTFTGSVETNLSIAPYTTTPLNQEDIMKIIKKDKVLAIYIWSFDCKNCEDYENELLKLVENFNGTFYLNSLNTYYYPDIPILDIPYLKIIGKNGEKEFKLDLPDIQEIKEVVCSLFENEPKECEKL